MCNNVSEHAGGLPETNFLFFWPYRICFILSYILLIYLFIILFILYLRESYTFLVWLIHHFYVIFHYHICKLVCPGFIWRTHCKQNSQFNQCKRPWWCLWLRLHPLLRYCNATVGLELEIKTFPTDLISSLYFLK